MFHGRPIRPLSLGERLASEIRRQIIDGEIARGTKLIEESLAESFQVSRGPVRDAIKILRAEGLVSTGGRSVESRGLTVDDIDDLMGLREAFEALAVERAMRRHPERLRAELEEALTAMDRAATEGDAEAFTAADLSFHAAFFSGADHSRIAVLWNQFRPTIEGLLYASGKRLADLQPSAREHRDLAELISEGMTEQVKAELHRHLQMTCARLQSAISTTTPAPTK